ncbi:MAG: hypothetical protein M3Q44_04605 [bacterium]|nr:hypothetical protein [bacterium]
MKTQRVLHSIPLNYLLCIFILAHIAIFLLSDLIEHVIVYLVLSITVTALYLTIAYKIIHSQKITLKPFIIIAGFLACLYLLMNTNLSSDMYRYIWDGSLLNSHLNPYYYRPIDPSMADFRKDIDLFSRMGWTNQYTVYPPLAQIIFWLTYKAYIFFGYIGAKVVLASPMIALGYYLYKNYNPKTVALYLINPVILFECFYGAHIDIWAVFFTILTYHYFKYGKYKTSSLFLALGVLTKIFPIIFLPLFLIDLIKRKQYSYAAQYLVLVGLVIVAFYMPFIQQSLFPIIRYQSWVGDNEFNSSIYYIEKLIIADYFHLSISLVSKASLVLFGIGSLILWRKKLSVNVILVGMLLYLLFSPVVYPWYSLFFIPFALIEVQNSQKIGILFKAGFLQGLLSLTYIDQLLEVTELTKKTMLHEVTIVLYLSLAILIVIFPYYKKITKLPDFKYMPYIS